MSVDDFGTDSADAAGTGAADIVVRPDWSAPAHVQVFCTTRAGGVSAAPYESMNLGLHTGDDRDAVLENRRLLCKAFGLPSAPRWLRQVHGTDVMAVRDVTDEDAADGVWTDRAGEVVAVMTADCLPVVLTDSTGSRVVAVHAGWRGLAAGVLERAVRVFKPGARLHAWLGPAIGPGAFEVGAEVRNAFLTQDRGFAAAFIVRDEPGKYLADLYALARIQLAALGDIQCSGGDHCTFTEADRFHSYRRDGARSGRMGTVAWLA